MEAEAERRLPLVSAALSPDPLNLLRLKNRSFSLFLYTGLSHSSNSLAMAVPLPSLLRTSSRAFSRVRKPALQIPTLRPLSTKHPKGFVPPTEEDLAELRERVQEFTSACQISVSRRWSDISRT